jgi:O-antigen ligase
MRKLLRRAQEDGERWLLGLLCVLLPFQTRILLRDTGMVGPLTEWTGFWFYASDVVVFVLLVLWLAQKPSLKDLAPIGIVLVLVPSLFANPTMLALWRFLQIAEGAMLLAYIRARRHWMTESLARPGMFHLLTAGIALNALIGIAQFGVQRDLGLSVLDESPLAPDMPGVAKLTAQGGTLIRAYGITGHPNVLAMVLVAGLSLVAFLFCFRGMGRSSAFSFSRQREAIFRGVLLLVMMLGLAVTFSRSGWVTGLLAIGLFFGLIAALRRLRTLYLFDAARVAVLFGITLLLVISILFPFVEGRIAGTAMGEQAVTLRQTYAQAAVEMIRQEPLTGVGLGEYVDVFAEQYPSAPEWMVQPVHNMTLLVAAEAGLPAMAVLVSFFTLLIIATLRRLRETHDPSIALSEAFAVSLAVAILLFSLTDHLLWTSKQGTLLLWMTMGLLAPPLKSRFAQEPSEASRGRS